MATKAESNLEPAAVPSEDELTLTIAQLFAKEFDVGEVDADAHFLFLGGDSLNAESLIAAIGEHFSLRLQTGALLDAPTPRALAKVVGDLLRRQQVERR